LSRRTQILLALLLLVVPPTTHALTHTESIGDVSMTVYAPDWIWQKSAVNILVTFKNSGSDNAEFRLRLHPPSGKETHFEFDAEIMDEKSVVIPAGATTRYAFTNIVALDGVHLQTYDFVFHAERNNDAINIAYPLTTIRGPVVNTATWATLLPAGLCAAWCIVFVIALQRFATPGAWKEPSQLDLDLDQDNPS
jgi:hypothetical protein